MDGKDNYKTVTQGFLEVPKMIT